MAFFFAKPKMNSSSQSIRFKIIPSQSISLNIIPSQSAILKITPPSNNISSAVETQKGDVHFACVKVGGRLRIRITSLTYNQEANCQFPRAIRQEGRQYTAPALDVTMSSGSNGKFFYRVKKANIKIIEVVVKVEKIFEAGNQECVVCMEADYDVVIAPCGHYCMCSVCALTIQRTTGICPICRGEIKVIVPRDKIQI